MLIIKTGNGRWTCSVLQAANVPVYLAEGGTAGEALARFQRGELPRQEAADVAGHWA
jgi:predicted Fe-Mo cluster-binding NifX family protein